MKQKVTLVIEYEGTGERLNKEAVVTSITVYVPASASPVDMTTVGTAIVVVGTDTLRAAVLAATDRLECGCKECEDKVSALLQLYSSHTHDHICLKSKDENFYRTVTREYSHESPEL